MGIDYAYKLFFEDVQAQQVLEAVSALAYTRPGEASTVAFATGESISVPFTSSFNNASVSLAEPGARISLDTALWFDRDSLIDEYVVGCGEHGPKMRAGNRVRIGYIYLYISRWNTGLVEFDFTAAASDMSRLFERSPSIRALFVGLLEDHGGVCGVFDDEDGTDGFGYLIWPEEFENKFDSLPRRNELLRLADPPVS